MNRSFLGIAVATVALAVAAPAAANLIVNGSFEVDNFGTNGDGTRLGLIGTDVTGWYIPAGDGVYPWGLQNNNVYGAGPAAQGNQWFVLGEAYRAEYTIQQTVTGLTSGGKYTLGFAIASELGCCSTADVSFLSGATGGGTFTAPSSGSYWTQWSYFTLGFTANASSVTIQFKNLAPSSSGYDLGLDDVTLVRSGGGTVPEPASWALMIAGFGLVGTALRRRAVTTAA